MRYIIGFFFSFCIAIISLSFTTPAKEKINWITLEELNTAYPKEPKPVLIDIYTSWCGWCKEMDRTTYKNDKLSTYVNAKYYAVKFDAESKATLTFNGKQYKYNAKYRTNDLAIYLTGGQLSYPKTVFMSGINAQPAPLPGYMKPKQMEAPLKYFGEKADKTETFVVFSKKMKAEW
jgi:thioredoxin-related protein